MFNSSNRLKIVPWAALVAISLTGTSAVLAERDDYKVAPGRDNSYDIKPETKASELARAKAQANSKIRQRRADMRDVLSDSDVAFTKEKEADFDKWYLGYEFPTMTLYTPEALKDLYDARKHLIKEDLERAENLNARKYLVDMAFKFFKDVAREDYHPAVRYNAMLIVGELDSSPAVRTGDGTPPVPVREALGFMIQEYKNPDQIDAVRLAALLGISRHVQLDAQPVASQSGAGIPQAELQEIRTLALDLVKTRQAPAGRTQEGHDWMRRRGLEILSWIAHARLDQEIVNEIIARLSDSEENRGLRAEAALALDTVRYQPQPGNSRLGSTAVKIKPKEVAASLLQFVLEMVTADVDRVDKYIKSIEEAGEIYTSTGGGGRMTGGSRGGSMMGPSGGGGSSKMGSAPRPGGSGMGPSGGGSSKMGSAPKPGGSSMGPSGGGSSKMGSAPRPGGSSMGPSGGGSGMRSMGSGMSSGMGSFGSDMGDPYSYRLDPVYRKLRYEIGCAMRGLRGTDDWRPLRDTGGGLHRAQLTEDDKDYVERAAKALKEVADKLKKKTDELKSTAFVVDKLALNTLTKLTNEVVIKSKPKTGGPELKDPLSEPDPAVEPLEPEKPAATTAVEAAPKAEK